jgi:hypothetical protein
MLLFFSKGLGNSDKGGPVFPINRRNALQKEMDSARMAANPTLCWVAGCFGVNSFLSPGPDSGFRLDSVQPAVVQELLRYA